MVERTGTGSASWRRTIAAAAAGNFAEWYDWGVYGVVATVLATHFFPPGDRAVALLSTYALFAVSYITRPFGSLIFGRIGDKVGRSRALSLTILITCGMTALIGVLPTYQSIGVLAPILLLACRLVQSLGTGGEYSAAISFVYEHSPEHRKGRYVSVLVALTFLGMLVGSLGATVVSSLLSEDAYQSWGWRILFLLAAPMGAFGVYLRSRTEEGPEFKRYLARRAETGATAAPVGDALRRHWRRILVFCLFLATWSLISATLTNYITTFLTEVNGLTKSQAYVGTTLSGIVVVIAVLLIGPVMDRIGLRRGMIYGAVFVAVFTIPGFLLAGHGLTLGIVGACLLGLCKGVMAVPSLLAVSQIFPPEVRVTAGGLSYNIAQSVFGGTAPLVALSLNGLTGGSYGFGAYLVIAALVTLVIGATVARGWVRPTTRIEET